MGGRPGLWIHNLKTNKTSRITLITSCVRKSTLFWFIFSKMYLNLIYVKYQPCFALVPSLRLMRLYCFIICSSAPSSGFKHQHLHMETLPSPHFPIVIKRLQCCVYIWKTLGIHLSTEAVNLNPL